MKPRLPVLLKYLFYLAVAFFAATYAVRNAPALLEAAGSVPVVTIILAALLVLAGYLARFRGWRLLSRGFELGAHPAADARAWSLSYLGRYVPGNAGLAAVRMTAYPGVPLARVAGATVVEYGLTLGSAATMVLAGMPWLSGHLPGWVPAVVSAFAACLLLVTSPPLFRRVFGSLLRLFGHPVPERYPALSLHAAAFGSVLLGSAMHGLAFALLTGLGGAEAVPGFLTASSGYFLGGLAGALFILSPAGFGVREGVAALALGPALGVERVVLAAGMMRGLTVLSEMLLTGLSGLAAGRRGRC